MRRALLLVCALVLAGCFKAGSPLSPTVPLEAPFDLKVGASAVVPGGLTLRFDAVTSDSRCPLNALCVQAGEAVVAMTLAGPSGAPVQTEWRTTPSGARVRYGAYTITLDALQPYPYAPAQIAQGDYVATLVVSGR